MKTRSLVVLLGALMPSVALAQGGGISAIKPLYEQSKGWITKAAQQMDESNYSFKPTPEVRSFGQIIGHLANSQYEFCAPVKGEASPNKTDFEKTTAKADLIKALNDAFAYCDAAFQTPDSKAMDQVDFLICQVGSCVKKRKMVPTSPFEDHVLRWIKFLNHQAGNGRVLFPALNDLAHIHGLRIVCH